MHASAAKHAVVCMCMCMSCRDMRRGYMYMSGLHDANLRYLYGCVCHVTDVLLCSIVSCTHISIATSTDTSASGIHATSPHANNDVYRYIGDIIAACLVSSYMMCIDHIHTHGVWFASVLPMSLCCLQTCHMSMSARCCCCAHASTHTHAYRCFASVHVPCMPCRMSYFMCYA